MRKEILYALFGACAGAVLGFTTAVIIQRVKENKERKSDSPLLMSDTPAEPDAQNTPEEGEEEEEIIVLTEEEANADAKYRDILVRQGYVDRAETEFPQDDDPEEIGLKNSIRLKNEREAYRKAHEGKIEMMGFDDDGEAQYDTDFPEEDYHHQEGFYFPRENILCDDDGGIMIPMEKYVGDLIKLAESNNIEYDCIYIRNHVLEEDYKINRITTMNFEGFFDLDSSDLDY